MIRRRRLPSRTASSSCATATSSSSTPGDHLRRPASSSWQASSALQLPGGEGRAAGDGRTLLSADGGINVLTNTDVTQDRVTLLTRPEAVSVSALPADARPAVNAAFGTVEQRVYRGASVHVYTRLDDGPTILAYRPQGTDLNCEPGARVMVSWSEDKVRVLYH